MLPDSDDGDQKRLLPIAASVIQLLAPRIIAWTNIGKVSLEMLPPILFGFPCAPTDARDWYGFADARSYSA